MRLMVGGSSVASALRPFSPTAPRRTDLDLRRGIKFLGEHGNLLGGAALRDKQRAAERAAEWR